jgi:opacity protein-like surface antigen
MATSDTLKILRILAWHGILCLLILGVQVAQAETIREAGLQLEGGYRLDELDWTIAGTTAGTNPNILSELTWEDLEIYQLKLKGNLDLEKADFLWFSTVLQGSVGYGWITDGENQDSDYIGDNRTLEFSRSNNETDADTVFDWSLDLGFKFRFFNEKLTLTPRMGYSYHEQNLNITDGVQTVDIVAPVTLGPFPGLDSTYETEWSGPWAGLELEYLPTKALRLFGRFEYHWGDYEAEANWNLRTNLDHPKSFTHNADFTGTTLAIGASYALTPAWSCELNAEYLKWETDAGTDRTFFADGTVGTTRLNEVNWESRSIMLGLQYRFY